MGNGWRVKKKKKSYLQPKQSDPKKFFIFLHLVIYKGEGVTIPLLVAFWSPLMEEGFFFHFPVEFLSYTLSSYT